MLLNRTKRVTNDSGVQLSNFSLKIYISCGGFKQQRRYILQKEKENGKNILVY
jgi:hypothetical protein